jgi:hypothetical protein
MSAASAVADISLKRRGRSLYLRERSLFTSNFSLFYSVGNSARNFL